MLIAISDDLSDLVAVDHYEVVGSTFTYRGSYPLLSHGVASVGRIIALSESRRIAIEHNTGSNTESANRTLSYSLDSPPQTMRGLFFDTSVNDCNGYTKALFRHNSFTNNTEMIVINGQADTPVLERYSLGTTSTTLLGSATLDNYLYTKLTTELSADQQSILVYGIKRVNTLSDFIQIRSASNLQDITFEKRYFD